MDFTFHFQSMLVYPLQPVGNQRFQVFSIHLSLQRTYAKNTYTVCVCTSTYIREMYRKMQAEAVEVACASPPEPQHGSFSILTLPGSDSWAQIHVPDTC